MRTTWVVGFAFLYLIGVMISFTLEQQYIGGDTTSVFYAIIQPDFGQFNNPLTAIGGFFILVFNWIQALWAMFWWDYSFLTGTWEMLRYFGWCLSIGMVVSLVLALRGTGST